MTFIAHPSVRVKGTEHRYSPALCQDEHCRSNAKGQHMHCPFCSVLEAYQDPVILRAHYRVKHVDKGLDFVGLKVIRCCNRCEIVGTIKGEKKFKGAHWHCYCCRNGFNRRDEAVKHYRTHFRNPHISFQIQVTQDINSRQYYESSPEAHPKAYGGLPNTEGTTIDLLSLGSAMAQTSVNAGSPGFKTDRDIETFAVHNMQDSSLSVGIQVGVEETSSIPSPSSSFATHQSLNLLEPDGDSTGIEFEDVYSRAAKQVDESIELAMLQKNLIELQQQNHRLSQEKRETEQKLHAEILQLKQHIRNIEQENLQMSKELKRYRQPEDLERRVNNLVQMMEWQHRELLQIQVASLRKEFAKDKEYLVNGKSHSAQELGSSATLHARRHVHSTSSENGSSNGLHLIVNGGPLATMDDLIPKQVDLGAGELLSFISQAKSSSPATMEVVDVLLHKEEPCSHLDAIGSQAYIGLFPLEAVHDEPTSPVTQPSLREKRSAGHMLQDEDKLKLLRTV